MAKVPKIFHPKFFCKQSILKMGISQPLFLLIDLQLVDNMLPMVGFEQRISGI